MASVWNWLVGAWEPKVESADVSAMGPYEVDARVDGDKFCVLDLALGTACEGGDAWFALLAAARAIHDDMDESISALVTSEHVVFILDGTDSAVSDAAYVAGRLNAAMALATGRGVIVEDTTVLAVPDTESDVARLTDYLVEVVGMVGVERARVISGDGVHVVPQCWLDGDAPRDDAWVFDA